VKRLPHDPHSPEIVPSGAVENRRAPPHSRHGRALALRKPGSESSERSKRAGRSDRSGRGGSRRLNSRGAIPAGTYEEVAPHPEQVASMFGPPPERNVKASPHAGHGGPSTAGAVAFHAWRVPASAPCEGSGGETPPSADDSPPPWRIVSWWPQEPQLPIRTVAGRASYSIAVPQSGQVRVMFVRPGTVVATSLVRPSPPPRHQSRAKGSPERPTGPTPRQAGARRWGRRSRKSQPQSKVASRPRAGRTGRWTKCHK
jgi:hypothetical protein